MLAVLLSSRGDVDPQRERFAPLANDLFGCLSSAGWGMRIAFVPEEYVTENPKVEIGDPKKGRR
jgi:hypothetical protein